MTIWPMQKFYLVSFDEVMLREIQPFIYGNLPFLYKIKILLAKRLCHVITLQMLSPSPFLPLTFPMLMASGTVCPRESSFSTGRDR